MSPFKLNTADTQRVVVLFSREEVKEVDEIGLELRLRSRSDAIRHLIRRGQEATRTAMKAKGPAATGIAPDLNTLNPA